MTARGNKNPCKTCGLNVTPKNKPGVCCYRCQKAVYHFTSLKIPQEDWPLYSLEADPKTFVCKTCVTNHRISGRLSLSQLPKTPAAKTPAKSPVVTQPSQVPPPKEPSTKPSKETSPDNSNAIIQQLLETVAALTNQVKILSEKLERLESLNSLPVNNPQPKPVNSDKSTFFTINGIPPQPQEKIDELVEKVIATKTAGFKLDTGTTAKRLPSRTANHHTKLISTKRSTPQFALLKKVRGSFLEGKSIAINCQRIYINQSHTSSSYQLFKKSKIPKSRGFQSVRISGNRVFACKTTDEGQIEIEIHDERELARIVEAHQEEAAEDN